MDSEEGSTSIISTLSEIQQLKIIDEELKKAESEDNSPPNEINTNAIESKTIEKMKKDKKSEFSKDEQLDKIATFVQQEVEE